MSLRGILHRIWIWGPLVAYGFLIFHLSGLSQIPWASRYPDYVAHSTEYMGLAVLTARALNNGLLRPLSGRILILAFLLCVGYAISDEIHQMFVPDRYADITDVLSDAAGAGAGLLALHFGRRLVVGGGAA